MNVIKFIGAAFGDGVLPGQSVRMGSRRLNHGSGGY